MKSNYFNALNYTLGDEDSRLELELLPPGSENVFSIAGSGGRILPLLAKRPTQLNCVDILKEQLFLTELRVETVKALNHEEFCAFWGYLSEDISPSKRQKIFESIKISDEARSFLTLFFTKNKWSKIIYMGKFEKMLIQLSQINNMITRKKGKGIFFTDTLEEQKKYYSDDFPHFRWKIVLFLLGNSTVLNSILYKGDFPKKNIEGSTYQNFKRIFSSIFETIHIKESFFAQMAFWGNLEFKEGYLIEADPKLFQQIKEGALHTNIKYIQGDVFDIINKSDQKATFVSLSDVPSFLKGEIEKTYLKKISGNIKEDALVVVRGNLRVTDPISSDYTNVTHDYEDLIKKETTQLWKLQMYKRNQHA